MFAKLINYYKNLKFANKLILLISLSFTLFSSLIIIPVIIIVKQNLYNFSIEADVKSAERISALLENIYNRKIINSFDNKYLKNLTVPQIKKNLQKIKKNKRIIILNKSSNTIFDSYNKMYCYNNNYLNKTKGRVIINNGKVLGYVFLGSMINNKLSQADNDFINKLIYYLFASYFFLLLVIISVISILSKKLLNPLKNLETVASKITSGDYSATLINTTGNDEIAKTTRKFNKMARTLKKANEWQKNLLSDIVHDLKTPISIIKGEIDLISLGINQPNKENIASLKQEIQLINKLIDEIKLVNEIKIIDKNFDFQKISIKNFIISFIDNIAKKQINEKIKLIKEINITEKQDYFIFADKIKLNQVLMNIVNNSIKYFTNNKEKFIKFHLTTNKNFAIIIIEDSGNGIDRNDINKVFDRFYRADKSRNSKTGGNGLGLAICKEIILKHKGKIKAIYQENKGTIIEIKLPLINS